MGKNKKGKNQNQKQNSLSLDNDQLGENASGVPQADRIYKKNSTRGKGR